MAITYKVSRPTIDNWINNKFELSKQHFIINDLFNQIRKYMPRLGSAKLHHILKFELLSNGIDIGRDKFHENAQTLVLMVLRKKMFFRTTDSNHLFNKHSNLVKGMKLNKPEQLWLSGITYIKSAEGTMYLSLITEAYSKKKGHY